MHLVLIEVKNFLAHDYTRLEIPGKGVYLLRGVNGAGKSSLIDDAVAFALYGFRATRYNTIAELRNDDYEGKDFYVKVEWELEDGTRFQIQRGLDKKGKSFATIVDSHGGYEENDQGVTKHRQSLIGYMDSKTYYRSYMARQGQLSSLTDLDPKDRAEFINKMLHLDIFDAAGLDMRRRANKIQGEIKTLEATIGTTDLNALMAEKSKNDAMILKVKQQAKDAQLDLEVANKEAERYQAELIPLRQQIQLHAENVQGLATLKSKMETIQAQLENIDAQHEYYTQQSVLALAIDAITQQGIEKGTLFNEMKAQMEQHQRYEQLAGQLAIAEKKMQEFADLNEHISKPDVGSYQERLGVIAAGLSANKQSAQELKEHQHDMQGRGGQDTECPLCLRPLQEHDRERLEGEYEDRLMSIANKDEKLVAEKQALESELADKRVELRAWEQMQQRLGEKRSVQNELDRIKEQMQTLSATAPDKQLLARLEEEVADLRSKHKQAKEAKAWTAQNIDPREKQTTLMQERGRLQNSIADMESWLGENKAPDPSRPQLLEDGERRAHMRAQNRLQEILQQERELQNLKQTDEKLDKEIRANNQAYTRIEQLREDHKKWKTLDALTKSFKENVAAGIRPKLEESASRIMANVAEGEFTGVSISPQYDIGLIRPNGKLRNAKGVSGGEGMRANLALRLALTQLITHSTGTPIQYIVLDEIFGNQDAGHRELVIDLLHDIQKQYYSQIFVISHVESLGDSEIVNYVVNVDKLADPSVTIRAN